MSLFPGKDSKRLFCVNEMNSNGLETCQTVYKDL